MTEPALTGSPAIAPTMTHAAASQTLILLLLKQALKHYTRLFISEYKYIPTKETTASTSTSLACQSLKSQGSTLLSLPPSTKTKDEQELLNFKNDSRNHMVPH